MGTPNDSNAPASKGGAVHDSQPVGNAQRAEPAPSTSPVLSEKTVEQIAEEAEQRARSENS
jgi:hypothetical protein